METSEQPIHRHDRWVRAAALTAAAHLATAKQSRCGEPARRSEMIEPIEMIRCAIGETLIVAVSADRIYVASRDDNGSEPVLMLTADEAHLLGTKLRLAAKKAGRS